MIALLLYGRADGLELLDPAEYLRVRALDREFDLVACLRGRGRA